MRVVHNYSLITNESSHESIVQFTQNNLLVMNYTCILNCIPRVKLYDRNYSYILTYFLYCHLTF